MAAREQCLHLTQWRYGRTDTEGNAIVEHRCEDCGQTVNIGTPSERASPSLGTAVATDGGEIDTDREDVEHHPDGFHSGDHHILHDDPSQFEPDVVDPENACIDCGDRGVAHCQCCGFPLCGRHAEVGAGFCSNFGAVNGVACCVVGDTVYVHEPIMPEATEEVLVSPADRSRFHIPLEADEECTAPACRPSEVALDRVAVGELPDDAHLCPECEAAAVESYQEQEQAAANGGGS